MLLRLSFCFALLTVALASSAQAQQRSALVIGNGSYKEAPLRNAANDATDIAKALRELGFKVVLRTHATKRQMEDDIRSLGAELAKGGIGLFYFAGHGIQSKGINYLIPVDAKLQSEADLSYEAVDANLVLSHMEHARNPINILVLDACRNNPFARNFRSVSRGLAQMQAARGSFIAFATAPDSVASDGDGRNGLYTKHLLASLRAADTDITKVFTRVAAGVSDETNEKQIPWYSSSLRGEFSFRVEPKAAVAPPVASGPTPQLRIGVFSFAQEQLQQTSMSRLIADGLRRLDIFQVDMVDEVSPSEDTTFDYSKWQRLDRAIIGKIEKRDEDRIEVAFQLLDISKRVKQTHFSYVIKPAQFKATSYVITDTIVEKLTGLRGIATSKIAYVVSKGSRIEIRVAEWDFSNPQTILAAVGAVRSLTWSPDGASLAYLSYDTRVPLIVVHDLANGKVGPVLQQPVDESVAFVWDTRSSRLVVAETVGGVGEIYALRIDRASRKSTGREPITKLAGGVSHLAMGAADDHVVVAGGETDAYGVYSCQLDNGAMEMLLPMPGSRVAGLAALPGNRLAILTKDISGYEVVLFDRNTKSTKVMHRGRQLASLTASPDGRLLKVLNTESGSGEIVDISMRREMARVKAGPEEKISEVSWSPRW